MVTSIEYASFLIRLWRQAGGEASDPCAECHSEVEHIQTGEHWDFETVEELLDFLRLQAHDLDKLQPSPPHGT